MSTYETYLFEHGIDLSSSHSGMFLAWAHARNMNNTALFQNLSTREYYMKWFDIHAYLFSSSRVRPPLFEEYVQVLKRKYDASRADAQ